MQNEGKMKMLEHTLLAAKWLQTKAFKGKVTLPEITNMDRGNQLRALQDLKNSMDENEDDADAPINVFVVEFQYRSDYEMFVAQFIDKGYKVNALFKEWD